MEKVIVPLSLFLSLIGFAAIAKWYVVPASDKYPRDVALVPLILPHAFRHIGLWFLIPGVTAATIDPGFAGPAAWGDLGSAMLAWLAILSLRGKWPFAIALIWVFSIWGMTDLGNALVQGNLRLTSGGELGATFFIPALIVPALLVSHVLIVRRLWMNR